MKKYLVPLLMPFLFPALVVGPVLLSPSVEAAIPPASETPENSLSLKEKLRALTQRSTRTHSDALIFDLPVTYNKKVSTWIHYYQTRGRKWFREWLERSSKYMPFIQKELQQAGLPLDLAYMVMI